MNGRTSMSFTAKYLASIASRIGGAVNGRKPKPASLLRKYGRKIKADDALGLYESLAVRLIEAEQALAAIKDRQSEDAAEFQKIKSLLDAQALSMGEQRYRLDALERATERLSSPGHTKEQASLPLAADRNSSN